MSYLYGKPFVDRPARARLAVGLAVLMLGSSLAFPAGASEPSSRTVEPDRKPTESKFADRTTAQPRIDGYKAQTPRGATGDPQLFDEDRPSGPSYSESLAFAGDLQSSGPGEVAASTKSQAAPSGVSPAKDLAWSLECDADPDTAEPFCEEPTGYYWVHGDIEHRRRQWVVDPGNSPHPQAPQYEYSDSDANMGMFPAREVLVRVADGCGLHYDAYTDADGHYSIMFPSWCGEKDATVTLYSVSAPGAGKQVALGVYTADPAPQKLTDMVDDPNLYTVVAGEVGTFNPENDAKCPGPEFCIGGKELDRTFQSYEQGRLFEQGKYSRTGEVARALTMMETTMTAMDYYRQLVDPARLPQINLVLTDQPLQSADDTAFYRSTQSHLIYIPPKFEWSAFAVVHETGHYFDGWVLVKDGLKNYGRWGEPMANLRAVMILGGSHMVPSNNGWAEDMDVQGNWNEDAEEIQLPDLPESTASGGPSQGWVWRILYDLHDGTGPEPMDFGFGDFDQWDGGGDSSSPLHHLINGVVMQYLPQKDGSVHPDYVDRGQPGPDLVDMLDGFACLYGMDHLHLETLLHDVMGYDYDFAHCSEIDDEAP